MFHNDLSRNDMKKTPDDRSGGFLLDHRIIPLVVILLGTGMAFVLSKVTYASEQSVPTTITRVKDDSNISPLFTPEIQYWDEKILEWSKTWNLDPNLIATVMQIESCGFPKAKSGAGAMGLFQVMPYHFSEDDDPYKPNKNAKKGLAYLSRALETREGDSRLALAGYNGGISGTMQPESNWSAETTRFVYWGSGIYEDAVNGKRHSNRLDEWLGAGGASLCKVAAEYLGIED